MSLRTQLLMMMAILLIAELFGILYFNLESTRTSLNQEIRANAQNTVDTLGVVFTKYLVEHNMPAVHATASALFDHGNYLRLKIETQHGKILVHHHTPQLKVAEIPAWFIKFIPLETPIVSANIMQGWDRIGKISLQSSPNYAYLKLWQTSGYLISWMIGLSLFTMLFCIILLKVILKPLKLLCQQAEAIHHRGFFEQKHIPRTRELRTVVAACNKMVSELKHSFERRAWLAQEQKEILYRDELTLLGNHHYFEIKLDFFATTFHEFITGALCLYEINRPSEEVAALEIEDINKIIKELAALLQETFGSLHGVSLAHLASDQFGILLPHHNFEQCERLVQKTIQKWKAPRVIHASCIGYCGYWHEDLQPQSLLLEAEDLLKDAKREPNSAYRALMHAGHKDSLLDLPALLSDAIKTRAFTLHPEKVIHLKEEYLMFYLMQASLATPMGACNSIYIFSDLADEMGDAAVFAQEMIEKTCETTQRLQFVHLSHAAIRNEHFIDWLTQKLPKMRKEHNIGFIISEEHAITYLSEVKQFSRLLYKYAIPLALDRVGREFSDFTHIRALHLHHIIIYGAYTRNIDKDAGKREFIEEILHIAHSFKTFVIADSAQNDAQKQVLQHLGFDGIIEEMI